MAPSVFARPRPRSAERYGPITSCATRNGVSRAHRKESGRNRAVRSGAIAQGSLINSYRDWMQLMTNSTEDPPTAIRRLPGQFSIIVAATASLTGGLLTV